MIFRKLTATFGKLDHESLELHEGLNIITAPNEAGKSTWGAFLLAMLYGIDTGERSKNGSMPAKTKYKPWSGSAMAGSAELEWDGRTIYIERGPSGRTPMGAFAAYESGRLIPELTGENCGQTLVGAERNVFERSAFIRQAGLAISPDAALERRLLSLVTTGDEEASYSQTEKALRALLNRRKHNKTGLIPQCESTLARIEERLAAIRACNQENAELLARRQALCAQQELLSAQLAAVRAQEAAEKLRRLRAAEEAAEAASAQAHRTAEQIAGLPEEAALRTLLSEITKLETGRPSFTPATEPAPPEAPAAFAGLSRDAAQEKAEAVCEQYNALTAQAGAEKPLLPMLVLPTLLALGSIAVFALAGVWGLLPLLCAAGLTAAALVWRRSAQRRAAAAKQQADALLRLFGAASCGELRRMAADYRDACLIHEQRLAQFQAQQEQAAREQDAYLRAVDAALSQTRAFAQANTLADCHTAAEQALARHEAAKAAAQRALALAEQLQAVRDAIGVIPDGIPENVPDESLPSAAAVAAQLSEVDRELEAIRSQLDLSRGRVSSLGDPAELEAEREQFLARLDTLRAQYDALETALGALSHANQELQTRFSPQINREAARIMALLTGGRYESVLLSSSFSVSAKTADDVLTRPLAALSAGTADQLYFALRLAIAHLALPPDAPLILDDALVQFDDDRLAAAMELLREEAQTRQILLFTCQGREQDWLDVNPFPGE